MTHSESNKTDAQLIRDCQSHDQVAFRYLVERIRRLSYKLPPKQRIVFTLRDLEDLSISDVVRITGISKAGIVRQPRLRHQI